MMTSKLLAAALLLGSASRLAGAGSGRQADRRQVSRRRLRGGAGRDRQSVPAVHPAKENRVWSGAGLVLRAGADRRNLELPHHQVSQTPHDRIRHIAADWPKRAAPGLPLFSRSLRWCVRGGRCAAGPGRAVADIASYRGSATSLALRWHDRSDPDAALSAADRGDRPASASSQRYRAVGRDGLADLCADVRAVRGSLAAAASGLIAACYLPFVFFAVVGCRRRCSSR